MERRATALCDEWLAQRAVIVAAECYEDAADWYCRCLEDVQDRRPVRGLAEAKAGFDSARDELHVALAAAASAPPNEETE